jgi:hypothetical protein
MFVISYFLFIKLTNQTQEMHMLAMLVNGSGRNKQPSIDSSYQVSVHLAKQFQMRRLKCLKLTDDTCQVMAKAHIAFAKLS